MRVSRAHLPQNDTVLPVHPRRPRTATSSSRAFRNRFKGALLLVSVLLAGLAADPAISGALQPSLSSSTVTNVTLLALLDVRPETNHPAYERSLFRHWTDTDRDCQDTRVEVLVRDDQSSTRHGCRAVSGSWSSWLDGQTFTSSRSLDVDHLVALKEAWRSGAHAWQSSRRKAFANDLGFEWSLRAVSASANRSKSDRDPAKWLPLPAVRCEYVSRWMAVKYRWGLAVDPVERSAIKQVLQGACAEQVVKLPLLAGAAPSSSPSLTSIATPSYSEITPTTPVPAGQPAGSTETSPAASTDPRVHPGAFCAPAGATGVSSKGVRYVCRTSETDVRNRWRRS
jgi:hypothetical protein